MLGALKLWNLPVARHFRMHWIHLSKQFLFFVVSVSLIVLPWTDFGISWWLLSRILKASHGSGIEDIISHIYFDSCPIIFGNLRIFVLKKTWLPIDLSQLTVWVVKTGIEGGEMSSISDPTCVAPSFPKLERSIPKDPIQTWSVSRADIWQAMHESLTSQLRHAHNWLDTYMNAVQSICTLPNNIPTNIKLTAPFTEFEA